jgi:hypothetical protein
MMQNIHVKLNPVLPLQNSIQQEEDSFHQQTGLKFKEITNKVLHLAHSTFSRRNFYTSESRAENTWKVLKCGARDGWRSV